MADESNPAVRFRTTRWTVIIRSKTDPKAVEELLLDYWRPIYAFFIAKGCHQEDAMELTNGFIADVIYERNLLAKADRAKGRFRSFLVQALTAFRIDKYRQERGRDGQRPRVVAGDDELVAIAASTANDPRTAFDNQWDSDRLQRLLTLLEQRCHDNGLSGHWRVFEMKVLIPARGNCTAPSMEDIARSVGVESAEKASKMLYTVKRNCEPALREILNDEIEDEREIEAEIAAMRQSLLGT